MQEVCFWIIFVMEVQLNMSHGLSSSLLSQNNIAMKQAMTGFQVVSVH